MSVVKTYYPKPEDVEIANGKDESTATGQNLKINTRNEDVSVRTISSDDPVSINAGTGNDTLLGGDSDAGNDYIFAGGGNDFAQGRLGKDTIDGGDGNDTIDGGLGDDTLNGSAGDDSVTGGDGADTIIGGEGNDSLSGGAGDDVLNISTGDSVNGGAGTDFFNVDLSTAFDASKPIRISDFVSGEDQVAILGQDDAKLSYDPNTKEVLLNDQKLIQLDPSVVLREGDLLTSTGGDIPFEAVVPVEYKLSGLVFNDTNASNAIDDNDKPIAGVEVKLFAADGTTFIDSKTTNADGFYEFTGLADGDYVVKETQPNGYDSVTDKDGGTDNKILAKIAGADSEYNYFLEEKSSVDPTDPGEPGDTPTNMYEFFCKPDNSYFYTVDENEKNYIEKNLSDKYEYKGDGALESVQSDDVAMAVDPLTGEVESEEVYRFFNKTNGSHLYTTDEVERDSILQNENYTQDDNKFYAYEEQVEGSIAVYRFYDAAEDVHMFTHSEADKAEMEKNSDFTAEADNGVAFYIMPVDMI
jgi:hypothetical protein